MYVGRIVSVGRTKDGRLAVMYRVSSRSFPNREAQINNDIGAIVPKKGCESDVFKNPYIAYNCLRLARKTAIATNGSHTDPIVEKVSAGVPVRDAFVSALLTLDYEKDDYCTPRIAAAVTLGADGGFLGVVREDGIEVRRFALEPGECFFVSTYETNKLSEMQRGEFDASNAKEGAEFILARGVFQDMTNAVGSICAIEDDGGFELALADV